MQSAAAYNVRKVHLYAFLEQMCYVLHGSHVKRTLVIQSYELAYVYTKNVSVEICICRVSGYQPL